MFTYKKYMYSQANTTPRYKKWAHQPIYNKTKIYIMHHSWCLYRTTNCSSLKRSWPTTTCTRWWWSTHGTLLTWRQASTRHSNKNCCSSYYGLPWWQYPHTLLQETLILDSRPHALRHILQNHLQTMTYIIKIYSDHHRRSM
jgi:hypothetical protein